MLSKSVATVNPVLYTGTLFGLFRAQNALLMNLFVQDGGLPAGAGTCSSNSQQAAVHITAGTLMRYFVL